MADEHEIWKGSPSQWLNAQFYLICVVIVVTDVCAGIFIFKDPALRWMLIAGGFVAAGAIALWKWLEIKSCVYELTNQRLKITTGILSKRTEDLELYRVKDTTLDEPVLYRMVGLGNITLQTSDKTTPTVMIRAIPDAATIRDRLRAAVEKQRDEKKIRELDVE